MNPNNKLAVVAGNGELTTLLINSAKEQGYNTYALAITEEAKHRLSGICDKVYSFAPGQISKMLRCLENEMINKIVFIGKVPKIEFLRNLHKLDWLALKNLKRFKNYNDDSFHSAIVDFLREHDIEVLSQTIFLKHLFIEKEILSNRKPTLDERTDIEYGFEIAKKIATLDIGQTVVVRNKMILAIEAIEGTDEAIRRGSNLAKGEVVVVKVSRQNHDERFDIPTIGTGTVETLAKHGGGVLAFEATRTIVADIDKTVSVANKYNVCLVSV